MTLEIVYDDSHLGEETCAHEVISYRDIISIIIRMQGDSCCNPLNFNL